MKKIPKIVSGFLISSIMLIQSVSPVFAEINNGISTVSDDEIETVSLAKNEVIDYMSRAKQVYADDTDYSETLAPAIYDSINPTKECDIPNPVNLSWNAIPGATSYTLYISESNSFPENNTLVFENITGTSKAVYHLYVNTQYYWKAVANNGTATDVKTFKTANTIRFMKVDGMRNVRDIGGWNGLNQGLVYRGSEMNPVTQNSDGTYFAATEEGKRVMLEEMGIKTDLDLRAEGSDQGNITASPLGDTVNWISNTLGSYISCLKEENMYKFKNALSVFADSDNYPVYFHCYGGADRTGTVAFLLEALAGVSEVDLSIDFEATTFAHKVGYRRRNHPEDLQALVATGNQKISGSGDTAVYEKTYKPLREYGGDTINEQVENYALYIGLTHSQISNIRSILAGNGVAFENPSNVQIGENVKIALKHLNGHTVKSITSNNGAVDFSVSGNIINIPSLSLGLYTITLDDDSTLTFETSENTTCFAQNLDDKFTRLTFGKGAQYLSANQETRLSFDVIEDGNYAMFLGKSSEANGFNITITNGTDTYTLCNNTTSSADYGYEYVRLGAEAGEASSYIPLTKGTWSMKITPKADTAISYIDIRSTNIDISGGSQGIYAADYSTYDEIASTGDVNGAMNTEVSKNAGYSYYGNLASKNLDLPWAYNRTITIGAGKTVTYKLKAKGEGDYTIYIDGASKDLTVKLNDEEIETYKSGNSSIKGLIILTGETDTLTLTANQSTSVNGLRIEQASSVYDITINAETDYDIDAGHGLGWYDTTPNGYDDQLMVKEGYGYVDVYSSADNVGGAVAYMTPGEWFKYNVNVDLSGYYRILLGIKQANNSDEASEFEITVNDDDTKSITGEVYRTNNVTNPLPWDDFGFVWLNKGQNTIKIKYNSTAGNAQFDAFRLVCPDITIVQLSDESNASTIEAETVKNTNTSGGVSAIIKADGRIVYANKRYAEWTINVDAGGIYNFSIIANSTSPEPYVTLSLVNDDVVTDIGTVYVENDGHQDCMNFPFTTVLPSAKLKAGDNVIRLTFYGSGGNIGIDKINYTASEKEVSKITEGTYTVKLDLNNWYTGKQYGENSTTLETWTADIKKLAIIAVIYDNELSCKSTMVYNTEDLDDNNVITIDDIKVNKNETVKLFIWDKANLKPLFGTISYN